MLQPLAKAAMRSCASLTASGCHRQMKAWGNVQRSVYAVWRWRSTAVEAAGPVVPLAVLGGCCSAGASGPLALVVRAELPFGRGSLPLLPSLTSPLSEVRHSGCCCGSSVLKSCSSLSGRVVPGGGASNRTATMCERSTSPLAVRTAVAASTMSCSGLFVGRLMTWKVPVASAAACAARWSCPPGFPTITSVLRAILAATRELLCVSCIEVMLYSDPVRHFYTARNYSSRESAMRMPAEETSLLI